jgi:hypothetical protein
MGLYATETGNGPVFRLDQRLKKNQQHGQEGLDYSPHCGLLVVV